MPIRTVPGTDLQYYLIAYDEHGKERREDGRFLGDIAAGELATGSYSDVFILSHGWKGDMPSAIAQYDAWIGAMLACTDDVRRAHEVRLGFRPLVVGFHWPSLPWGDESLGSRAYVAAAVGPGEGSVAKAGVAAPASDEGTAIDSLVDVWAKRIADTNAAREALGTIFAAALRDIEPERMPSEVVDAYLILDHESGLRAEGVAGAPDADREPFDPVATYEDARAESASFGQVDLGGLLSPLRQLSFWQMKARALAVGQSGGHALLAALRRAAPASVRFHLMGHSFGCIVASAVLMGELEPVDTLFLAQGALSLWAYCMSIPHAPGHAGHFHSIVRDGRVHGPILTTRSRFDTAVGRFYPLGAGIAGQVDYAPGASPLPKYGGIGTFGIQGPGLSLEDLRMRPRDAGYDFRAGHIYNLDADAFIRHGSGLSGAHSDIAQPAVAHAFWCAVLACHAEPEPVPAGSVATKETLSPSHGVTT